MKIDEPDTPWASPPRELEDEEVAPSPNPSAALAQVAEKLGAIQKEQEEEERAPTNASEVENQREQNQSESILSDSVNERLKEARERAEEHRGPVNP